MNCNRQLAASFRLERHSRQMGPPSVPGKGSLGDQSVCHSPDRNSFRLERHSRKCAVCQSPDRGAIEQGLRHWRSPAHLSCAYQLSPDSIYRHARALQFYPRRYPHFRSARELGRWAAYTQGSRVDGKSISGDQSPL
jgi:hypothetical protein